MAYKRKLSNYLLDKGLQLRYIVFVTLLSAVISSSLGYLIWRQEADASDTIMQTFQNTELSDDEGLKDAILERLDSHDDSLVLTMFGVGVGLVIVLSLYMLVMTHKVAGPLFKISKYFEKMAEGKLGKIYALRQGDMLQDFYEQFRESHDAVRERHRGANDAVRRFLDACERASVGEDDDALAARLEELASYHERRTESLS